MVDDKIKIEAEKFVNEVHGLVPRSTAVRPIYRTVGFCPACNNAIGTRIYGQAGTVCLCGQEIKWS